jgi:hypothetical protein
MPEIRHSGLDAYEFSPLSGVEFHRALAKGEQGVVPTPADVDSRVEPCSSLPDQDLPRPDQLPAEALHAQSLGGRIASVPGASLSFFMGHFLYFSFFRILDFQFNRAAVFFLDITQTGYQELAHPG